MASPQSHVEGPEEWSPKLVDVRRDQPERVEYLERMIANNVTWWANQNEWGKMVQFEIIDRKLVAQGSDDHKLIMQLLLERLAK